MAVAAADLIATAQAAVATRAAALKAVRDAEDALAIARTKAAEATADATRAEAAVLNMIRTTTTP